jgi:UDP-glucose 4-epimerase
MAKPARKKERLTVAVTGASGDFGELLLPRLAADPRVERIVAIGTTPVRGEKVEFRRIDLTRSDIDGELRNALQTPGADALYHLALRLSPVRDPAFAHELEVIGSRRVLAAAQQVGLRRLVVPSFTVVYGATRGQPALLREGAPLLGCAGSRFVTDKVEIERQVRALRERVPQLHAVVLRFAPPVGPGLNNPLTRFLHRRVVPTLLGFDPLWQAIHPEDVAEALHRALHLPADGDFNIVGRGVLPLSGLIAAAGGQAIPLPWPAATGVLRALRRTGYAAVPLPLLDYLRYSCVADGSRAESVLGFSPRHHAREAAAALREV